MSTLKLFLKFEFEKGIKYYKSKTLAKSITTLLFFIVFTVIGVGIYHFFVSSFRYINVETEPQITSALLLFLYELFLLILCGITIFSSAVSGIFNLFRGKYDTWLIASPLYTILPKIVLLRSLLASLLPALVLFLPAALALQKVYTLGNFGLFFILLSIGFFLITINTLTLFCTVLVGYTYYTVTRIFTSIRFSLGGLIGILLFITAGVIAMAWKRISNLDLLTLFKTDLANNTLDISNIGNHFMFLPTHPLAMEIINWQSSQSDKALLNVFMLFIFTGISISLWWSLSFLFYPLWQKFQEGSTRTVGDKERGIMRGMTYRFTGDSTTALFKKEALVFTRNWKGILWFLFLALLWLMQVGANIVFGHSLQKYDATTDLGNKIINLQVLQYIIAIYFISSFALRFVFPSFSVEKKTAWILGSAPLSFKKIFFGKYFFYTSFFVVIGMIMTTVSNNVLRLSFTHGLYFATLFISAVVFIVTLGLSLGAIFPSFETDDPEAITTSMPGLFFTALALIYGAIGDGVLYVTLTKNIFLPSICFVVATFLAVSILLIKTPSWSKHRIS